MSPSKRRTYFVRFASCMLFGLPALDFLFRKTRFGFSPRQGNHPWPDGSANVDTTPNRASHFAADKLQAAGSTCILSKTGEKQICSMSQVCWLSEYPHDLYVFDRMGLSNIVGKSTSPYYAFTIHGGNNSWSDTSTKSTVTLRDTTVLHILYQSAFQHFAPDFYSLLQAYWNPSSLGATAPVRSIFLTNDPHRYDEEYIEALFLSTTCPLGPKSTCTNPVRYPFMTLPTAFGDNFDKEFWCREGICNDEEQRGYSICFERLILSLRSGAEWLFDEDHSDILATKVLGQRSQNTSICVHQRKGTRQIKNIEQIIDLFERIFRKSPSVIFYEGADFQEQARRTDPCLVFLAPHGAGMTNTVFLRRDAVVIEIFPHHYKPIDYYGNAVKSTGAEYIPVVLPSSNVEMPAECDEFRSTTHEDCLSNESCQNCFKDGSMVVDLNIIQPILEQVAAKKKYIV